MLRRLSEQNQILKLSINKSVSLKKAHFVGPVPNELASRGVKGQYSEMVGDQWTIKISTGDNTFVINGDICRVYNVVECTDATYIVYKRFSNKSVFFTYPFSSDFLNIFSVSLLSEHYVFAKVCAVAHKCVLLPHRGGFVAIPIQHSQPSIRAILLCTTSTSTILPSNDILIFSTSTTRPSSDILIFYTSTTHPASAILMFSISTTLPFRAPLLFCISS
ncbi:hypothetical protein N1851_002202 [Merluccius polli]|uniref:Uncharacterized protein n=1 Tax=Merluccius polli TaxID=89951 RepID=A0AA47NBK7_MERPO|nr:hypothetical protein N1851_002202 [Merluccius polli]